jgi:peptidoglycan hydrolase-like protein with peptidoglycan-binding domain
MKGRRIGVTMLLATALAVSACGEDEPPDVEAAQQQFCTDVQEYVEALDTYGGLFADVELTVGEVRSAAEDLDPAREAVVASAEEFQQAVEADSTEGVTVELVAPETIEVVEQAEAAFADAVDGINDRTPVTEAAVAFTSAAYSLQVAWVRAFADAGCLEDEDAAQASQWVADYVAALQTDLQALGYYSGSIDGIYGPKTVAAVEELQEANDLPVTGLPDPATQAAIQSALAGAASAQVAALQGILVTLGYFPGPIDGQWSPQLEEALRAFQTDLGVPATGKVDPETLRAFEEALQEEGEPPATAAPAPEEPDTTRAPVTTAAEAPTTTAPAPPTTARPTPEGSILDVLADAGEFSELLAAIDTAGLTDRLNGSGPFTLFAPTDDAFSRLETPLPDDPAELEAIILHHLVEEELSAFDLLDASSVTPAEGGPISVSVEQGLLVLDGTSTVTITNVAGGNGLAHAVDTVLIPGG